jgi:hypothetical protein
MHDAKVWDMNEFSAYAALLSADPGNSRDFRQGLAAGVR